MNLSPRILPASRVSLRGSLLKTGAGLLLLVFFFALRASAQEKSAAASPKHPSKTAQATQESDANQAQQKSKFSTRNPQHEDSEQLRKREEWFYKQRASPLGHIPAGARLKAFQHMQRMMEAEGKLVRQPNGGYLTVTPQANPAPPGSLPWSPLGPAPTSGGFFSPVSGRIEAIAVDPSDTTGNTVLIGGAQGGVWRTTNALASTNANLVATTWTPMSDANPSLAMGSIAFANPLSPGGAGIVYAGTGEQASIGFDIYYGAGILKSTDGGKTWNPTCPAGATGCNNPFIGPFTNTLNFGFFNDGGARISYIAVNPSNANLVLVGAQIPRVGGTVSETAGGIYCSSDGGLNWSSILLGGAGSFVGFATSNIAYAALGRPAGTPSGSTNPNGIYKSTNANAASCSAITFTRLATQPTAQSMGRIDLGIAPSDAMGNTVYASIANGTDGSSTNLGVWVTTNGGTSWTQTAAPDICQFQCWYDNVVKVDPSNANTVYLGGGAVSSFTAFEWVMRSTGGTNGGAFSPAIPTFPNGGDPSLPHVDQHAMAFFKPTTGPDMGKVIMYLGNDGGLWRTDDAEAATVSWTNLNQNLTLTQFYPSLSVNPSNPTIAFGGAQDNGSQVFQGVPNWTDNQQCGDGGQTAVDFLVPTTVYVDCQDINLSVSTSGGTNPLSYVVGGSGINPNGTDNFDFIPPIAADPSTAGRLYFGTDHVYQSSDSGNTFTAISGVLPTSTGAVLTALGVSPKTPAVVYAGANDGEVFVSTNVAQGSATFAAVGGQSQLPHRNVTALVVDPADATGNTAYAVFSGFAIGTDTQGHIFKTTNGGTNWTDVSCSLANCASPNATTDLPNIPVNDLVVDPDIPGTLYAATDVGAFQGTCTVSPCTWNTLGTGLPNVAVLSLKLHEPSRTLIAGTHGRGAWSLSVPFAFTGPHISSISPFSAQSPATSPVTLTVNGSNLTGGTVQWKENGVTTALAPAGPGSGSQLMATIPTNLLSSSGTAQVFVTAAAVNSNSLTFAVLGGAPTLSSLSPASTPVQTPNPNTPIPITLTGTGFTANSQVAFNGSTSGITVAAPTASCALPTCLQATLPANLLGPFGSTDDITAVNPPPGAGASNALTFKVVAPPPPNDNFVNAINITMNSFGDTQDSSGATTGSTDPVPPCAQQFGVTPPNGDYNTIWYKFTPTTSGTANIDTIGSNYDTVLSVWTGMQTSLTAVPNGCNDDINPGINLQSQLQNLTLTGGTTYFIMVSSFGPPDPNPLALGGKSVLHFTFTPPPFTLTPQPPTSQTVTAGSNATYTVAVASNGSFIGTVNLSCTSPATATTCSVSPPSVTLTATSPSQNVTVTVTTTKRGALPPPKFRAPRGPLGRTVPFVLLALLAILLFATAGRTRRRLALALPLAGIVLLLVFQAMGCSGGGGGGGGGGTPAGTYTITVTGTSGATASSANVTLIVN